MRLRALLMLCGVLGAVSLFGSSDSLRLDFRFADSAHGFTARFADLPEDHEGIGFDLESDWRDLPEDLGLGRALYIAGSNRSDDLWMHWQREISGLEPGAEYFLTVELEFLSQYGTGTIGVGGSPGDSVFVKAGAAAEEPVVAADEDGVLRLNWDKGNQMQGGEDLPTLGTVATPFEQDFRFALVTRDAHGTPQRVKASETGTLWLVFGTDSGFEGFTELYYTRLRVWLSRVDTLKLWMEPEGPEELRLIWNSGQAEVSQNLGDWEALPETERPVTVSPQGLRFWRLRAQ